MEKDLELKHWLEFHKRRFLVVATKFDKLKTQRERHQCRKAIRQHISMDDEPVMFSAVTGQGVSEIWQTIRKTTSKA